MTTVPVRYDLIIYQGATLSEALPPLLDEDGNAVDLTGYSAQAMAREDFDSEDAFMDLSTENGGILLAGSEGPRLYMDNEDTGEIDICKGVWDIILITPGGEVIRHAQGTACVKKCVTRGSLTIQPAQLNFSRASNSQYLGVI